MDNVTQAKNNVKQNNMNDIPLIEGTGEVMQDISSSGRVRPWAQYKKDNAKILELYKIARELDTIIMSDSRMVQMNDCASTLLFDIKDNGKRRLKTANFCRVRLCPVCSWRKSLKLYSQVSEITNTILDEQPNTRFLFLTLTVKNVPADKLKAELDRLNAGWRLLVTKNVKFAPAKKLKSSLLGYMKATEITYNSGQDTYHPHIHAILVMSGDYFTSGHYMTKSEWSKVWQKAIKVDYHTSIDIQAIDSTDKAVAEVAKYPVKASKLVMLSRKLGKESASNILAVLHNAMFNKRLVTFGGIMAETKRKLKLDDIDKGDLTHIETDNEKDFNVVARILFKYRVGQGVYTC